MPATFLGAVTIGGALVGLNASVGSAALAFGSLRDTVAVQVAAIDGAVIDIEAEAANLVGIGDVVIGVGATIDGLKASLRVPVAGGLDLEIAGIIQGQLSLTADLSNPLAYIQGLISGAQQAIASLTSAVPTVEITGQLTAAGLQLLALQAEVATIDAALALLDGPIAEVRVQGAAVKSIAAAIGVALNGIEAISAALDAAIAAADVALSQLAAVQASLGTAGGYAFVYEGPLSGLGAALDSVTPGAGISGAAQVLAPVVFVLQADAPAVSAVNSIYLTS